MRVLLIAESANPRWVSVPLEGWSHSRAIARHVDALVATQVRNREAFLEAGLVEGRDFVAIDSEKVTRPLARLAYGICGGKGKGWTTITAISSLSYLYFERQVWKLLGRRIREHEFDVVHRLTPLSPTASSPLAGKCAKAGVPFVLGPLNGGLPWPREFDSARRREREWLSYIRGMYRLMPGYRATRRHAGAIIVGSRATRDQMPTWAKDKCVYIPENAVDPRRFDQPVDREPALPLRVAFVGRLVPYKQPDLLIDAAEELIRQGRVVVEIIGDGPLMPAIREQVTRKHLDHGVSLPGWVDHTQLQHRLRQSDVFAFPSIREFGGAVVLEAMALGLVPIVMDYGGPGELVSPATGFAIPMGRREEILGHLRQILTQLAGDPAAVRAMGQRARQRVLSQFTWDAKARQVMQVYHWVLGTSRTKPDFPLPLPDDADVNSTMHTPLNMDKRRPSPRLTEGATR
ncbi:MAG: glycosyltransferase family 4 protein [Phycisphaeraceae bacterium]|nr:glycosyltransferase family 4 protein [Phycisphaeraceae bacterium]